MEINKLRDIADDIDETNPSTSYFYLSEVNTFAAGDLESLVFNELEDQTEYPDAARQCSLGASRAAPSPVPSSTYLELIDTNGTLSGKIIFTMSSPRCL